MKVKVKFVANNKNIKALEQAQLRALELTAAAVLSDIRTSGVTPHNKGSLEFGGSSDSGEIKGGHVDFSEIKHGIAQIVFDAPYARRLYWHPEYNFRTDINPNAQGKWMETYHSGEKRKWVIETFAVFFKQEAKGLIK